MHSSDFQIKFAATLMLLIFSWSFLFFPTAALAATVEVPIGTTVVAVFDEAVDPDVVSPGQMVMLSVDEPVVINGHTVIEVGAPVLAEVTIAEKSGAVGKPAKIGVSLRNVTAVDGSKIPLSGQKLIEGKSQQTESLVVTILCCVLGLLMKGGKASIPAGAQVQATTVAAATVNTVN